MKSQRALSVRYYSTWPLLIWGNVAFLFLGWSNLRDIPEYSKLTYCSTIRRV